MVYDIDMLRSFYSNFPKRVDAARKHVGRPLTLAEKILYAHLYNESDVRPFRRGEDYVNFRPDRVAMQDATAQMALLQFMNAGKSKSAVPATVHCDHLIQANMGSEDGYRNGYAEQQRSLRFPEIRLRQVRYRLLETRSRHHPSGSA